MSVLVSLNVFKDIMKVFLKVSKNIFLNDPLHIKASQVKNGKPACSCLRLIWIKITSSCMYVITGAPDQFTYDEVKSSLESIQGVKQVHSLRLWSLTVDLLAANVHLQIGKS